MSVSIGCDLDKGECSCMKKAILCLLCFALLFAVLPACAKSGADEADWNDIVLNNLIPAPQSSLMKIISNDKTELHADIYEMSKNHFLEYVQLCEEAGFYFHEPRSDGALYSYPTSSMYVLKLTYSESESKMEILLGLTEIRYTPA